MMRLAVTGPESSGKTQLAMELSRRLAIPWVPEYAREYLEHLGRDYTFDDVTKIARAQWQAVENTLLVHEAMIADTELLVTAIWQEVRFSQVDPWINDNIKNQPFDLYLLCAPDIPWEFDPLREHPEMREALFLIYQERLRLLELPFVVVDGMGESRYQKALNGIARHLVLQQ